MKVTGVIEKSSDTFFSIYTKEDIPGFGLGGYGESVDEAKEDYMVCIEEMREIAAEKGKPFPKEIEVEFRYDVPSFFDYFDWINISAFAKKAGINESKMRAYKAGLCTASEKTLDKIRETVRKMCAEMSAATF